MNTAEEFYSKMEQDGLLEFALSADTVDEAKLAKKKLILHQKKLRQVKKEVNNTIKVIRAEYSQRTSSAGSAGSTVLSVFGKPKLAGSWKAAAKANLRTKQNAVLEPYNSLKQEIDDQLLQLDSIKIQCDEFIISNADT